MTRRANGEGSIYLRQDGRYAAAVYVTTTTGIRVRKQLYGKSREEVHQKLTRLLAQNQRGIPVAERTWRLGDYLDYWLAQVASQTLRPKTIELYESNVRLYLKPNLGRFTLERLTVPTVQNYLNQELQRGASIRKAQVIRTVLSAALTRAMREELIPRNVARLVELPTWERAEIFPWTLAEAKRFLNLTQTNPLFPAFLMVVLYGLRRGEVLGLRWVDLDEHAGILRIRQQLQRVGRELKLGPVKTSAGRRNLPLLNPVREALAQLKAGRGGAEDPEALVFTTRTGQSIEPRNFVRSFHGICRHHGLRRIKLHHLRHTTATLLKNLGVPARDAQLILGHSQISVTQQIYQHDDMLTRRENLVRVEEVLLNTQKDSNVSPRCCHSLLSNDFVVEKLTSFQSGGDTGTRTPDLLHAMQAL